MFWVFAVQSLAQNSKNFNQYLYNVASEKFKQNDFYDAIPDFEKLVAENPQNEEIAFKYGVCLSEVGRDQQKAIPFLKNTYNTGNELSAYYLGKIYFNYMQFDSANHYLNVFLTKATPENLKKTDASQMLDRMFDAMLLMNEAQNVKISNLENINSVYPDYSPVIKVDNSILYFTSKREDTKGQKKDENGQYYEDIYVSKAENSAFKASENVGSPLNSKEHDATVALSADGSEMILYRTDPYSGNGDLLLSRKEGATWSMPFKLGFNINSPYLESSASISSDGNTLYFTSNRPGGFGGLDIYKSKKGKNGVWGNAENLGQDINTKLDEESPFINSEGRILYFSSKGHAPNMGGFDIFRSELNENGKWKKPENMKYPINTLKDDLYFTASVDAKAGYLSSNRIDSKGDLDIYMIELDEKEPNITIFTGVVKEYQTDNYIKAEIEAIDRKTNKTVLKQHSNAETGEFLVILPNNKDIKLVFDKGNTIFTEIFDGNSSNKFRALFKVIELETK
ncbi:MAG: hypothetical protein ACKVOU_08955 [Cytophagales bacterium]